MENFTYNAADELDRRASNAVLKDTLTRKQYLRKRADAPDTAEGHRLADMGAVALAAEAGITPTLHAARVIEAPAVKAAKAPAKKATPAKAAKVRDPHTALRQTAWDWRASEYKAGRKHTVAAAYAKFGTHHASKVG